MTRLFQSVFLTLQIFSAYRLLLGLALLMISLSILYAENLPKSENIIAYFEESQSSTQNLNENITVTIFVDGHIKVYRPSYYKKSGTFSGHLDSVALNQLWNQLTTPNLLNFNEAEIQQRLKIAKNLQKKNTLSLQRVSDAPTTIIEIYPNRYMPPINIDQSDWDTSKRITWHALQWTVENFPELEELHELIEARKLFQNILENSELKPLN
ncbi:MAG: hypothetical protein IPI97_02705 [Nitrosomonas sp.]|nr:hypothetical protein [Nitrosomonas sp.]